MAEIKISGWNYVPTGKLAPEESAADWKKLGLNYPMSFRFDVNKHKKEDMLKSLNAGHERGLKVFLDDKRTDFRTFLNVGEEEYREGVKQAVSDFGSHPAVYGFHVGDEPSRGAETEAAIKAIQICNEYAPDKTQFINLLPYWEFNDSFCKSMGVSTPEEYSAIVSDFIKRSGIKMISYDCYTQCCYFEREKYQHVYFKNLRLFEKAARENNVEPYTCLLSVGHMSLYVPNEDDIRWQLSTAIASGFVGLSWFFIYERGLDGSFRNAPFDLFYEKTSTFEALSRQNRTFLEYYYERFKPYHFVEAKHFYQCYGGYEEFKLNEDIKSIEFIVNPSPLLISKFEDEEGSPMWVIVNMNRTESTNVCMQLGERFGNRKYKCWWAPGQMRVITAK